MIKELSKVRKEDSNYKRFKENKLFFRTRGLDKLQERFDEDIVEYIRNLSKSQKEVRILEIGFGEGKALLESMSLGVNIKGYGINEKKRSTLSNLKDLLNNAEQFNIKVYNKPRIFFYDAGKELKFKDNYFDIVFSQVAIHYVGDKAKLFEEVWRVLKKNGKAFLHIDSKLDKKIDDKQPDFMFLHKDTPRLIIYDKKRDIISTKSVFDRLKKDGFNLNYVIRNDIRRNITLVINKNTSRKLDIGLDYDGNSTIYLSLLKDSDKYKFDTAIWWGTRSVYSIR